MKVVKYFIVPIFILASYFLFKAFIPNNFNHILVVILVALIVVYFMILFFPKDKEDQKGERVKNIFLGIGFLITVVGWLVNGYFSSQQAIDQKKTDLRVKYLLDAYFRLENADRKEESLIGDYIFKKYSETALTAIQLLGEPETIKKANTFILRGGKDDYTTLLEALRNELRHELSLSSLPLTSNGDSSYHPTIYRVRTTLRLPDTISASDYIQLVIKLNEYSQR